jgi:hypothetical protein
MGAALNAVSYIKKMMSVLGLNLTTGFRRVEYDDIMPGSSWVTPQGATAPDPVTVTLDGVAVRVLAFDGGTTVETMSNSWEILHGVAVELVNSGTLKMEAHVHGSCSTDDAGVVVMQIQMVHRAANNGPPVALPTVRCVFDVPANSGCHMKTAGAEFDPPVAGFHIGDIINFNVFRDPTDEDDTYTGDFLFDQCALHAPFDGRGSRQRYVR